MKGKYKIEMKDSDPGAEPIAQNLIKLISNVCFSVFVFSVLIVTVVAITYQPPDPWLQFAPALTRLFTRTQKATFKNDDSVLKTGEDLPLLPPAASPAPAAVEMAAEVIANSTARAEASCDEAALLPVNCSDPRVHEASALLPVNCSDPRVLAAVKRFNARAFRSIVFLGYQAPVNGSKTDECDVAWRFRNRREKSWRRYRDFRRFKIGIGESCTYRVVHPGAWHSGVNARPPRGGRFNATRQIQCHRRELHLQGGAPIH